jgi:hypothetical protein
MARWGLFPSYCVQRAVHLRLLGARAYAAEPAIGDPDDLEFRIPEVGSPTTNIKRRGCLHSCSPH